MATKRILDEQTASVVAPDDYLYIDGATNGSRKITPENIVANSTIATQLANHISEAEETVDEVQDAILGVRGEIGDLSALETEDKSSLVGAINETAQSGGSGGGSIDTLTDVELNNLSNGQALTYDSAVSKWKNVTLGGGGSVTIDSAMSSTSTNPVQNKVIYTALQGKADSADIPTKTSDLTNDSGFVTDAGVTSFNGNTGAVTYTAPVTSVNGQTGAVTLDADDVGAESAIVEVTIATDGAVTQALDANKIYHFTSEELTSLTITLNATSGVPQYHFDFISPATAVTLTLPNTVTMPSNFSVDVNGRYEIDILNGYGAFQMWDYEVSGNE